MDNKVFKMVVHLEDPASAIYSVSLEEAAGDKPVLERLNPSSFKYKSPSAKYIMVA
jgi:hypothetical protein